MQNFTIAFTGSVSFTVIGGGGTPENGFGSEGYFLSGEEVAATAFFSTDYIAENHTANGIEVDEEAFDYAPQLAAGLVGLLEQPHTVILDGVLFPGSKFYLLHDAGVYFEYVVENADLFLADGTFYATNVELGIPNPTPPQRFRFALTHTNGSISLSVNGGAVLTDDADAMPYSLSTVVLGVGFGCTLTEFTIMSPQLDADLPALSAL